MSWEIAFPTNKRQKKMQKKLYLYILPITCIQLSDLTINRLQYYRQI